MYKEKEKIFVRSEILNHAVKTLTEDRLNATLVNPDYMRLIRDTLRESDYGYDFLAKLVNDESLEKWNSVYYSLVGNKKPSDLRVAYLSGPNPENDLEILTKLGVLPENVWAFESDNEMYKIALESALKSRYPHIKIQKCKISDFFNNTPIKFDIVYLDFCGPLPNRNKKQRNLSTLTSLFVNHVLNSPGVLITNFSLPTLNQDNKGRDLIGKLISAYLYRKSFLESPDPLEPDNNYVKKYTNDENLIPYRFYEGHRDIDFPKWLKNISSNLEGYYSQFITRFIIELSSIIIPYYSFSSKKSYMNQLFKELSKKQKANFIENFYVYKKESNNDINKYLKNNIFDQEKYYEDYNIRMNTTSPIERLNGTIHNNNFPILWSLSSLYRNRNSEDEKFHYLINNDLDFSNYAELFLEQISPNNNIEDLFSNIELIFFLISDEYIDRNCDLYAEKMCELSKIDWMMNVPQLCDLFLFHQIKEFLVRQLAVPYHTNLTKTRRWSYKAKKTRMFTDLFVFDECRYLYDWMPSIGMIKESLLKDINRQLIFRFVLDGVSRHNRRLIDELFYGTAAICKFQYKGLEFENLRLRKFIN